MATKSNYVFQRHPKVESEDLPALPDELRTLYHNVYKPILVSDPVGCNGYPNHALIGNLKNYRTLDINLAGISYRLVYRIYEKSAPKRVFVISFDEHDAAYEKAKERAGRTK